MLLIMPLPAMQLLSLLYAGTCLAFGMECGLRNDMFYKECPSISLDLSQTHSIGDAINCTIINGNLLIVGLTNTQCRSGGIALHMLTQVLGSVTIERSSCNGDLSNFLPNLFAIHGIHLFTNGVHVLGESNPLPPYSLLIHHTALSGIGLKCLRVLGQSGVILLDNPQMCYADTVGWHLLSSMPPPPASHNVSGHQVSTSRQSRGGNNDVLRRLGLYDYCANACPSNCNWITLDNLPRSLCWSQHQCQQVCAAECLDASLSCALHNASQCCHPTCLGGCMGPGPGDCLVCRNFRHNNTCIGDCPADLYGLYGRYCVTREACLSRPVPEELQPPSSAPSPSSHQRSPLESSLGSASLSTTPTFSIQGRDCVPFCDKTHRRSSSGDCLLCGDGECADPKKECGDIVIYQQSDLATVKHCESARSLLISIRSGQDDLSTALAKAFASLRVIHRSLRVIRSDALISLSFLHNLEVIHGTETVAPPSSGGSSSSSSGITALEITWNGNLERLWSMPAGVQKLRILSGHVEFSVNNRLCPDKIQSFLSNAVVLGGTGRDLTPSEQDLIVNSNGEYAICNVKPLNVTVVEVLQNSVTLHMRRIIWNDPRQILPAIISYGRWENSNANTDIRDRTFCDSAWNEVELNCPSLHKAGGVAAAAVGGGGVNNDIESFTANDFLTCQLDNLAPATSYSAFVTVATLSKHEGAQSRRFFFTTKPATPSAPTFLRAVSAGPNSIQLQWNPPNRPNGRIVEYRIRYTQMNLEKNDFLSRDSCYSLPFQPSSSHPQLSSFGDGAGRRLDSCSGTSTTTADTDGATTAGGGVEDGEGSEENDIDGGDGGGGAVSGGSVEDDGDDMTCHNVPSSSSSNSPSRPPKRSELVLEELQRREMIRFEDELHKIILIPRVPYKRPKPRPKRSARDLEFESDESSYDLEYPEGEEEVDGAEQESHCHHYYWNNNAQEHLEDELEFGSFLDEWDGWEFDGEQAPLGPSFMFGDGDDDDDDGSVDDGLTTVSAAGIEEEPNWYYEAPITEMFTGGPLLTRKRRYLGDLGLSMSPPAQPSTPHQKTIHVPVVDSPGASGGASGVATGEPVTTKQTYLLSGLEHYTEYLFFISACHEPHDEYGNPLPCHSPEDCGPEASCSQPVRISQRTLAIPRADEVPSGSLRAATRTPSTAAVPPNDAQSLSMPPQVPFSPRASEQSPSPLRNLSGTSGSASPPSASTVSDVSRTVKLLWSEPISPNGLILHYWLHYRRLGEGVVPTAADTTNETSATVPWFTICVAPKYLEVDDGENADGDGGGTAEQKENPRTSDAALHGRTMFAEVGFLRAGYYEWQVMAVSLAGNGSWSESHFFEALEDTVIKPLHLASILVVTLFAVSLVVGVAIWFDYRNRKRRLNALASRKAEHLEFLLVDKFQDDWEVNPKDLTYNLEDALGQGSFGLVCRGRLSRLTTPAAKYLQVAAEATVATTGSPGSTGEVMAANVPANVVATSTTSNIGGNNTATNVGSNGDSPSWLHRLAGLLNFRNRQNSKAEAAIGLDVAVKILSPGSTFEDVREFLDEASHMKQFSCNHIVRLLGIISKQVLLRRQPIVIMELMQHGDLATYLRHRMAQEDSSKGSVAPDLAIKWAAEVADGMAYLARRGFVHRDLAARNCLVGAGLTVKIGDFGLTRDISGQLYYRKQGRARLPVRWMAPEALQEAYFTSMSDVWSYGVVLWEIATFASLPFSGLSHEEVIVLVTNGGHLGKQSWPSKFPDILLDVMEDCWHSKPEDRPSFGEIIRMLEQFVSNTFRAKSFFLNESTISTSSSQIHNKGDSEIHGQLPQSTHYREEEERDLEQEKLQEAD